MAGTLSLPAGAPDGEGTSVVALLLDLRGLPDAVAQVVELGPAHVAPAHPLDLGDGGRMQGKRALDADAVADLADLEGLTQAGARASDHDALEDLEAFLLPLDHPDVHLEGVAGRELGDVAAEACLVDQVGGVHRALLRAQACLERDGEGYPEPGGLHKETPRFIDRPEDLRRRARTRPAAADPCPRGHRAQR